MPRTPLVPKEKVLGAVAAKAGGSTSADVATALGIPERTARRHLASLFAAHEVVRTSGYEGKPPVFHYRYHPTPKRRR